MGADRHWEAINAMPSELAAARADLTSVKMLLRDANSELVLLRARLAALRDLADTMRANPAPGETVVLGMIEVCLTATMGADGVLEATGEGPDEGES